MQKAPEGSVTALPALLKDTSSTWFQAISWMLLVLLEI
jgi:hypothetical protein